MQNTLLEIAAHLRGSSQFTARSPSAYPPHFSQQSPSVHSLGSPGMSTPSGAPHPPQLLVDTAHSGHPQTPTTSTTPAHPAVPMGSRQHQANTYRSPSLSNPGVRQGDMSAQGGSLNTMYASGQGHQQGVSHGTTLPPFSSLETMGPPRSQHSNVSSVRYHPPASGSKRAAPSSNVTSADSSDVEEDDGELPASGLVAPWEVLRGLADVAIERAAQVRLARLLADTKG